MDKIEEVVSAIASATSDSGHPMLVNRPVKKSAYIIVSSDRGLVGGYNANIFRAAKRVIEERHASKDDVKIVAIGRKGLEFFERLGYEVVESLIGVSDHPTFDEIRDHRESSCWHVHRRRIR